MRIKLSTGNKTVILILLILVLDQTIKILVKTNMTIGESITIFSNWFFIRFIENPGMAFGIDIPGRLGKPLLTVFRIIAVTAIGWYLYKLILNQAKAGLIFFIAMIFAGAMGNIIDCTVYGLIFNESTYFDVASIFPGNGGYAPLLHGRVVDMFYFPVINGTYPNWFPWVGGQELIFFRPIFNIADSSISIGILAILIFQKRYFNENSPVLIANKDKEEMTESKASDNLTEPQAEPEPPEGSPDTNDQK